MSTDPTTFTNWPWPVISAVITLLVLCILIYVEFVQPAWRRKQGTEKQRAVDELSESLSGAIHDLLNRDPPVSSQADLDQWESDFQEWCAFVSGKLEENFTRSEQLHFDRLGTVPIRSFGMAYNDQHNHLLNLLDIKFNRLREIIRDNQRRH